MFISLSCISLAQVNHFFQYYLFDPVHFFCFLKKKINTINVQTTQLYSISNILLCKALSKLRNSNCTATKRHLLYVAVTNARPTDRVFFFENQNLLQLSADVLAFTRLCGFIKFIIGWILSIFDEFIVTLYFSSRVLYKGQYKRKCTSSLKSFVLKYLVYNNLQRSLFITRVNSLLKWFITL